MADKSEIGQFINNERSSLLNYVRSYLRESAERDAEDVIQDVALNIFTKADFSRPIENVAAYVYHSLRNRIIDIIRKKKNTVSYDSIENFGYRELILSQFAEKYFGRADNSYNQEMIKKLSEAIDSLKPDYQMVIIGVEFEGYTYDELSRETGIPIGTLLSRRHRALAKLNNLLIQYRQIND